MKASWKTRDLRVTPAFILALLFGGTVQPESVNPNKPGDLSDHDDASLTLLVDEGRRQLQDQSDRFKHATDRAQVLLTVSLVALGFVSATFGVVDAARGWQAAAALSFWVGAGVVVLFGVAAAASVVVVKAEFETVDTTIASTWTSPILRQLAEDYTKVVILGETTIAARVTVFRHATRLVVWGTVLAALALAIARSS